MEFEQVRITKADELIHDAILQTLDSNELLHYGTLRKSGRYPYGSGKDPYQGNVDFLAAVDELKAKGMTEAERARGLGFKTTTQLRASVAIAKNAKRAGDIARAVDLKDKGHSNIAIGERMGINESSVRQLLKPATQEKTDRMTTVANKLKDEVDAKSYLDIGVGTEHYMGISKQALDTSVAALEQEGYKKHYVKVQQIGTGNYTTIKVLTKGDVGYSEVFKNQDKIQPIEAVSHDKGRTFDPKLPITSVSSKRVAVRYAEEGGSDMDGVVELRRGVPDISLGDKRYAQVRISVDGTHYLKGMAMYADDLPAGVDMRFNTNKSKTGNKLDAMKPVKDDAENPFGSMVKPKIYIDKDGKQKRSALNIVNEEGNWYDWSRNLSSQMLSKQKPDLAEQQLGLSLKVKKAEFDEINSLTNPAVKKKLLESFSDGVDASAVHLKAAGLPRTRNHVILPITSLKDSEVYAPQYRNGEKVVLIRHPHGGTFEIPELTVNNRNPDAKRTLGQAIDAIGINPKVASRLSGADFDGDTVLVIPNNNRGAKSVQTSPALKELKDFDPQRAYPAYDGMKRMSPRTKQLKMGDVSNLITDMTIKGATHAELARAVKHSMVVIDAEKHNLDWQRSAKDNNISELKTKYQKGPRSGADTLISQASSTVRVNERKARPASEGGAIDAKTGRKIYVETGESYVNAKGQTVRRSEKTTRIAEATDARSLISKPGTRMERIYAKHANDLKALANDARKTIINTPNAPYSPTAKKTYAPQVASLNASLQLALRNKPLERQAQLLANANVKAKQQANPDMDAAELKKVKGMALEQARLRTGAKKNQIPISAIEWEAIQAGAIITNRLNDILNNTNLDVVKQLATPRVNSVMSDATTRRAKAMLAAGYTQADIADALGVPTSTLNDALKR